MSSVRTADHLLLGRFCVLEQLGKSQPVLPELQEELHNRYRHIRDFFRSNSWWLRSTLFAGFPQRITTISRVRQSHCFASLSSLGHGRAGGGHRALCQADSGVTVLLPNNSFKPTPLRGAAESTFDA
ncbi:MAG: hypothetical protein J7507_02225, partial [Pseudoxanthomonas sp.]|nr:hypothetical protein [Pseudoxanthomonas sp.]